MPTLLTPEQARAALDREGKSIAMFSRENRLNKNLVSDLLNGRKKGLRGEAHRAAVLLGIKEGVVNEAPPRGRRKTDAEAVIAN
jgi:gp16 family phage-associated protein